MVLHFPFSTVRFPVILLFWSLSLSPVWLNIEGRQDFKYYTPILSFYSENNSESLNRSPNTNLIVVHCAMNCCLRYYKYFFFDQMLKFNTQYTSDIYFENGVAMSSQSLYGQSPVKQLQ